MAAGQLLGAASRRHGSVLLWLSALALRVAAETSDGASATLCGRSSECGDGHACAYLNESVDLGVLLDAGSEESCPPGGVCVCVTVEEDVDAVCCSGGWACGDGQGCWHRPQDRQLDAQEGCPVGGECVCVWSQAQCEDRSGCAAPEVCVDMSSSMTPVPLGADGTCPEGATCICGGAAEDASTTLGGDAAAAIDEEKGFTVTGSIDMSVGEGGRFVMDDAVKAALRENIAQVAGVPTEYVDITLEIADDGGGRRLSGSELLQEASRRLFSLTKVKLTYKIRVPSPTAIAGSVANQVSIKADSVKRNIKNTSKAALQSAIRASVKKIDDAYDPEVENISVPIIFEGTEEEPPQQESEAVVSVPVSEGLSALVIVLIVVAVLVVCCCLVFAVYRHFARMADVYNADPFLDEGGDTKVAPVLSFHKKRVQKDRRSLPDPAAQEPPMGESHRSQPHRSEPPAWEDDVGETASQESPRRPVKAKNRSMKTEYEVGDIVEVRAKEDMDWQKGRVVSASPLRVWPYSAPEDAPGMSWPFVRPILERDAPRKGPSCNKWAAVEAALVASQLVGGNIIVGVRGYQKRVSGVSADFAVPQWGRGDRVLVRSHDSDPWQAGEIVDPERLLVRLESAAPHTIPTAWKYVRRIEVPQEPVTSPVASAPQPGMEQRDSARRSHGWQSVEGRKAGGRKLKVASSNSHRLAVSKTSGRSTKSVKKAASAA